MSARYVLDEQYRLRGWYKLPRGLYSIREKKAEFLPKDDYLFLLKCDGAHDINPGALSEADKARLDSLLADGVVRRALPGEFLKPEQTYKTFPARYREEAHWSITGACNLRCRHCFMSAPAAKHGSPSREDLMNVVDQLAECGVCRVGITGGEPLVRTDFLDIVDALVTREIGISVIYTNGWLVNEALLNSLDERGVHPNFQLSFDGVGGHDFLRGVPGAEKQTLRALKLLQERGYLVAVSMCLHRGNAHSIRETVKLMSSFGVRLMKIGAVMPQGDWQNPEVADLKLNPAEEQAIFEEYIPQYFEDDAPLSVMLHGSFMYTPGDDDWGIFNERSCSIADERDALSCGVLAKNFYIGAEGMVAPCMGMCDTGYATHFPNLHETPLREIMQESEFVDTCYAKVADVRDKSGKCRNCEFIDRCAGGCRNAALIADDGNYFGVDPEACMFFENGWDKRIHEVAQPAFEAYIRRHPPKRTRDAAATEGSYLD